MKERMDVASERKAQRAGRVLRPLSGVMSVVVLVVMANCTKQETTDPSASQAPESKSIAPEAAVEREVVVDVYHGAEVADPYRWLEDWDDATVREWSEARNAEARQYLDELPGREEIGSRLRELLGAATTSYWEITARGDKVFAIKDQPPRQQPFLVVMPGPDRPEEERIVVDPEAIDPEGGTTIDWYVPSPDGKLIAVSLSRHGSEEGDLHVFETDTGRQIHQAIPRVHGGTAGGDAAWAPDGSGLFYTRYPRGEERAGEDTAFYQQVYFHRFGTETADDRYEIGSEFPRIAETRLSMHHASGRLLATVQDGDSGRFALHLRSPAGEWQQLTRFDDESTIGSFGPGGDLYIMSRAEAPNGKLVRLPAGETDIANAEDVIPEGEGAISTSSFYYFYTPAFLVTENRIYVVYEVGGPSVIMAFDHSGRRLASPEQMDISSVGGMTPLAGDDILFRNRSYVAASNWLHFDADSGQVTKLPISTRIPADYSDVRVVREFATSNDGTRVPVNILVPSTARLDGTDPLLLTAYGGYGLSRAPRISLSRRVLLDHGFIVAEANIRGGGEYGDAWHRDGSLTRKQNGFDDFAAVVKYLKDNDYTSRDRIAIIGGSNGGLLMGAAMTQHPDSVAAVVSYVGVYDMLRSELTPNGAFNIPEYGTVEDPEQFQALYAYSPYHNVQDGTAYPPALFLTGANDPRVDPMHSRKMTARLQEANSASTPVLLRTSGSTGHGIGTPLDEQIEEYVDVFSFLFRQLGVSTVEEG